MVQDQNKGINTIIYNHLNLPTEIQFSNNRTINYTYDADGVKLKKEVNDGTYITITDYLDGYQYEEKHTNLGGRGYSHLLFFPHAEGYVKPVFSQNKTDQTSQYQYVYNYKDRWNNVRVSYSKVEGEIKILEESNYYAFGLKHQNYNSPIKKLIRKVESDAIKSAIPAVENPYNYKYQFQERQNEFDLNWDSFKWRNYDYAIGRFMSIDPLSEDYVYNSTYAFQENKMGMGVELEGLELSEFFIGVGERVASLAYASPAGNIAGQVQAGYTAVKQYASGDSEGAMNTLMDSATLGIPALVNTVKRAATGDNKAQGNLVVDIAVVIGAKKYVKGGATKRTPTTEVVQRAMSKAELGATETTGLMRGGKKGTHYVSDAVNNTAKKAQKRLALPTTPEVKVTLKVPKGLFSKPKRVKPAFNRPGGGMERKATGKIPVKVLKVKDYKYFNSNK